LPLLAPGVSRGSPGEVHDAPASRRGLVNDSDGPDAKARDKALEAIGRADLVLLVLDATDPSYERMEELLGLIAAPMVVAVTKCDLAPPGRALAWLAARGEEKGAGPFSRCCEKGTVPFSEAAPTGAKKGTAPFSKQPEKGAAPFFAVEAVATSAVTGEGIDALRAALVRAVEGGSVDRQAAGPVVAARHRAALEQAAVALARAAELARCAAGAPYGPVRGELVALELRESLHALGAIVGEGVDGDVLDLIFSRFCIGK
jgi:tRNA U34 5-carboxymethylaminomethyl modifying GTPase MnmE/TrmE